MTWTTLRRRGATAGTVLLLLFATGCGLLEVTDPTAVEDEELNNADGAALLRGNALGQFYRAVGEQAVVTGELTDEFWSVVHGSQPPELAGPDPRNPTESFGGFYYQRWPQLRRAATVALAKLLSYGSRAHAGEVLALRGHATLRLAEDFCPGFPITELIDLRVVIGPALTTAQALERALADFDTALTLGADSVRVLNFARVGRAAALLNLGRFTEAAATVADVPTSYTWLARYVGGGPLPANPFVFPSVSNPGLYPSIADLEGANGLDFISSGDPRVLAQSVGTTSTGTPVYIPAKYANGGSPIVVASGIEARLIEAEAALATDQGTWLTILNELRATQVSPALPALVDPGTSAARLDLLFRERAFWLFATGHRLADLRRLIRLYGRAPETVFPTGPYHQGGTYGTATSIPFSAVAEAPNPAVTGCTGP